MEDIKNAKMKITTIKLQEELINLIKKRAQELGIGYQTLIRIILNHYFKNNIDKSEKILI